MMLDTLENPSRTAPDQSTARLRASLLDRAPETQPWVMDAILSATHHYRSKRAFRISCAEILALVALETGIPISHMRKHTKLAQVSRARLVACYLMYEYSLASLKVIGRTVSRDPASIINGHTRVRDDRAEFEPLVSQLETILDRRRAETCRKGSFNG
jgi:chromosomal replication initiation ATPase DnaA